MFGKNCRKEDTSATDRGLPYVSEWVLMKFIRFIIRQDPDTTLGDASGIGLDSASSVESHHKHWTVNEQRAGKDLTNNEMYEGESR